MLKIKNRIVILYSAFTIFMVLLYTILFNFLLRVDITREPIFKGLVEKNYSVVAELFPEYSQIVTTDSMGNAKTTDMAEIKKNFYNQNEVAIQKLEKEFINEVYKRLLFILIIVIGVIIVLNFILSAKYAKFALKPLSQLTKKVKEQDNFKNINELQLPLAKDEIFELTLAYNGAMAEIKRSYVDLQRFNAYASHELRNSLAVLKAKVDIGEKRTNISSYIDKLTGDINDILAMSTTKLTNNEEETDIALICAKIVDEYTAIYPNIVLNIPEEGVELIHGKELWIERSIINIIDNAIKFSDDRKKNKEVIIDIFNQDENIVVSIYDNGIGIDKNKLETIFEPFYGTNHRVSTGIGLAYVQHIMELHNGRILVESQKGEYSRFSLVFPRGKVTI